MSNSPVSMCTIWIKEVSAILTHGSLELISGLESFVCHDRLAEVASWIHEDQREENAGTFGVDNHDLLCGVSKCN